MRRAETAPRRTASVLRRRARRGYTVVELLMALAIFGVGITGVVALQKVTGASNQHARNLAIATHVAQSWLERLAADATSWTDLPSEVLQTNTLWLKEVTTSDGIWFVPATENGFGARFGALGQPLDEDNVVQTVFCAHLRLTLLNSPIGIGNATMNNGLVRAEVRVFWPRHADVPIEDYCAVAEVANVGADVQNFHFVYQATAIRQSKL